MEKTFEQFPLRRPNINKIQSEIENFKERIVNANDANEAKKVLKAFFKYSDKLDTLFTTIHVNFTLKTNDPKIVKLMEIANEVSPLVGNYQNEFYKAVLASKFLPELKEKFGQYFFDMIETSLKIYDPIIIEDLVEENKLDMRRSQIIGGAKIDFRGETYNLAGIAKFMQDLDRDTRKEASDLYYSFYSEHESELAEIYDKLVKIRDKMAKKLGFKNFIELGYLRLGRLDYDANDVKAYREQIKSEVVPYASTLFKRQLKRIEIKKPSYYDYSLTFKNGNPTPKGSEEELVSKALKMYEDMSEETGNFFRFMLEHHLMDLKARPGKDMGGYMTYFPLYKAPFVFANFNGTSQDVATLTHEMGHAFQAYESRNISIPAYRNPTLEACEIHSMSMEFISWPWMDAFFGDEVDKYRFEHLADAVLFLPYGAAVDAFQHAVYERPEMNHDERCKVWRDIEREYLPFKDYSEQSFLSKGTYWMRQSHIYSSPFYYIDYTLAQVVAFEFWHRANVNRDKAFKKYVKLCKMGGKYPFQSLLKHAGLRIPFHNGMIKKALTPVKRYLNAIDDKAL